MKMTLKCDKFRPWRRNTLFGFAEILISELHLRIKDIAIHQKGSNRWAQLPAKPQLKDGSQVKDTDGKAQYVSILEFTGREVRDAFSNAVVVAVLEHAPDAFTEGDEPSPASKQSAPLDDLIPF